MSAAASTVVTATAPPPVRKRRAHRGIRFSVIKRSRNSAAPIYELECIRAIKRSNDHATACLIKWKDFDEEHTGWEPWANLVNASDSQREFEQNDRQQWRWQYFAEQTQNNHHVGWNDIDATQWQQLSREFHMWCENDGHKSPHSTLTPDGYDWPVISSGLYRYEINFENMTQTNKDPRYGTIKRIRCLPLP